MINCYQSDVRKLCDEELSGLIAELEEIQPCGCEDCVEEFGEWGGPAYRRLEELRAERQRRADEKDPIGALERRLAEGRRRSMSEAMMVGPVADLIFNKSPIFARLRRKT